MARTIVEYIVMLLATVTIGVMILVVIVTTTFYVVEWLVLNHEPVWTEIKATVIGVTSESTGNNLFLGGGSKSICIYETDEKERYHSKETCYFVLGDRVTIHFQDGKQEHERLLESKQTDGERQQ